MAYYETIPFYLPLLFCFTSLLIAIFGRLQINRKTRFMYLILTVLATANSYWALLAGTWHRPCAVPLTGNRWFDATFDNVGLCWQTERLLIYLGFGVVVTAAALVIFFVRK